MPDTPTARRVSLDGRTLYDEPCIECGTPTNVRARSGMCDDCENERAGAEEQDCEDEWKDPYGFFSRGYD